VIAINHLEQNNIMNNPPTYEDVHGKGPGDEDVLERPEKPKPNVYKIQPPKPDYGEQDNWAGDPSEAWA
jgi:hypothetical protein